MTLQATYARFKHLDATLIRDDLLVHPGVHIVRDLWLAVKEGEREIKQLNATISEWEQVGDTIMTCVRGTPGPLSDSDVIGEIEQLRADLSRLAYNSFALLDEVERLNLEVTIAKSERDSAREATDHVMQDALAEVWRLREESEVREAAYQAEITARASAEAEVEQLRELLKRELMRFADLDNKSDDWSPDMQLPGARYGRR